VRKRTLAMKVGVGATLVVAASFAALRVTNTALPGLSILQKGEMVYSGKSASKLAGLSATETFLNVPMNWEDAVAKVKKEIPSAIERSDENGPYFVVPQTQNGRVRLAEFPEQSITVRPGRLLRVGARMMVRADSGDSWAHVQIQDFRQPSALESAFNWIGDRLGI
jgi:hypothetical protein